LECRRLVAAAALFSNGATITSVRIGEPSWIHDVGMSVSDRTLTKTGVAGWNAGGATTRAIETGDGFIEFSASETTTTRVLGLSHGDAGQSPVDIDFGIALNADGSLTALENNVSQGDPGTYATGDRFRVELSGGSVKYLQNGTLFYTSTQTPLYPLRGDAAAYDPGATLTDIVIVPLIWTNAVNVSITGNSLKKTGDPGWNAGAGSTFSIPAGDGWVEFTATETNTNRVAGWSSRNDSHTLADIAFGIAVTDTGQVAVYEAGLLVGTFGTYGAGDRFRVETGGASGSVRYRRNGVVFNTGSAVAGYPLFANASLNETGATVTNGLMGDFVWARDVGVLILANGVMKTAASGWGNAGAVSNVRLPSGDGIVEFIATEGTTNRMLGLSTSSHTATDSYTDITFGVYLTSSTAQIWESGVQQPGSWSYAPGDHFSVAVEGGVVKYRQNGALLYTSAVTPTYPLWVHTVLYSGPAAGATVGATLAQVRVGGGFSLP